MDPLPRRPVLLPGLHVLERGDGEVQVGLDPARAVVLPATDAVRRTLAVLRVGGPAADADEESLHHLHRLGLVAEAGRLPRPPVPRVVVRTFGAAPLPALPELLLTAGVDVVPTTDDAGLVLVAGVGEPDRDLLDPYLRDGVPHLLVRLTEGDAVVGPFVVPGRTACLRCVDAHHAVADVRWPLLVAQQAARTSRLRDDAVPEPVDPALAHLALAWAARDLFSHAAGRIPASWSATIRLPPDLTEAEAVAWLRHPDCGCWWNEPG
jgi:bacteriocin biosynthesis cyclodehydratase domain-containing protein